MSQRKEKSKIELILKYTNKSEADFFQAEYQRIEDQETLRVVIDYKPKSGLNSSIGVILGQSYDELSMKIKQRAGYVDCDNLNCNFWGQYTNCSTKGYKHCKNYTRSGVESEFGITLRINGARVEKITKLCKKTK